MVMVRGYRAYLQTLPEVLRHPNLIVDSAFLYSTLTSFDCLDASHSFPAQIIHQGTPVVDTLLLLSGLLAGVTLLSLLPRVQSDSARVCFWVLGQ